MGQFVILSGIIMVGAWSLFRPWIGVVAAYFLVLLVPQEIWWWHFQGLRPSFMIILPTIVGLVIAALRSKIEFSIVNNRRNLFFLILWFAFAISYYFGPYVDLDSPLRPFDASWIMSMVNNIFILYFLACFCIDRLQKIQALAYAVILSSFYLVYWANDSAITQAVAARKNVNFV